MRLTQWTDYALRVLMYCATHDARAQAPTIAEIAQVHGISRSHLMKVTMALSAQGWLSTTRGRGGGLRLLRPAREIVIGEVVRQMEGDFTVVECFSPEGSSCRLSGLCRLQDRLGQAMQAFMQVLDGVTLADLVAPAGATAMVAMPAPRAAPSRRPESKR